MRPVIIAVLLTFVFGISASTASTSEHHMGGVLVIKVPKEVTNALRGHSTYIGWGYMHLVTLVSGTSGFAALVHANAGSECEAWYESSAEGFAGFGSVNANVALRRRDQCQPFSVRKVSRSQVHIRVGQVDTLADIVEALPITSTNWQKIPVARFEVRDILRLGPLAPAMSKRLRSETRAPHGPTTWYCEDCEATLQDAQLRTTQSVYADVSALIGRDLFSLTSGEIVYGFDHEVRYANHLTTASDGVSQLIDRFGEPSVVYRTSPLHNHPTSLVWALDTQGEQLSEAQAQSVCNPFDRAADEAFVYRADSLVNPWACGLMFRIDLRYKGDVDWSRAVLQRAKYTASAPYSLMIHRMNLKARQHAERKRRYAAARGGRIDL